MKISSNSPCPCGSKSKYKNCCKIFHKGSNPKNALFLMKSRYCAYVLENYTYIIKTTHLQNEEYTKDVLSWKDSIKEFSSSTEFKGLEILDFKDGDKEAFVTFKATLFQGEQDVSFVEESRFLKENNMWLYHSGKFI